MAEMDAEATLPEDETSSEDEALFGAPYSTKTVLNSLTVDKINSIACKIMRLNVVNLELKSEVGSLTSILFGTPVIFSDIKATLKIEKTGMKKAIGTLLPLPFKEAEMPLATISTLLSTMKEDPVTTVRTKEATDVSAITKVIMSLASPPWILNRECTVEKKEGSEIEVPHGTVDIIIARKCEGIEETLVNGIAIMVVDKEIPVTGATAISAKTPMSISKLQSERQVVVELLAFAEAIKATGAVLLLKASRNSFRPYMYIRPKDALFKFPKFNYIGKKTIKGLLILYVILNYDISTFYKSLWDDVNYKACGWAAAFHESTGQYSNLFKVQKKPNPDEQEHSSAEDSPSNEDVLKMMVLSVSHAKRYKSSSSSQV